MTVMSRVRVDRNEFLDGLVECPSCRLHLDARKVVDLLIQPVGESKAIAVRVTHGVCGASFDVVFDS